MKDISIIVPVYNSENYIERCVISIINQTLPNWELILVDDYSTDNSFKLCKNYEKIDNRIISIINKDKGVSNARNTGIANASGKYILFVDSDDEISVNCCETMMKNIGTSDFLFSGYSISYDGGVREKKINVPKLFDSSLEEFCKVIDQYLKNTFLQGPCWKLFKRELILKNNICFPPELSYGEDAFFVYEYLKFSKKIKAIEECTYTYYVHQQDSLSHGFRRDKYIINIDLNKKIREICNLNRIDYREQYFYNLRNFFCSYLNDVTFIKSKKEAILVIKEAAENIETINAFILNYKLSLKHKIISLIINCKNYRLLYSIVVLNKIKQLFFNDFL